jgi:glucosamine--fructose-6-phosphate aminotransferase (isomerizing)
VSHLEREIFDQPDVLQRLLESEEPRRVAEALQAADSPFIVTLARGSSDNAVTFFGYLAGRYLGLPVASMPPSLLTVYGSRMKVEKAIAIAVSQSGRSEDVRLSLESLEKAGALTVAITNDPSSPLARAADHDLQQGAGEEHAVAATKTFTSQMMLLALLVAHWSGDRELMAALDEVPGAMRSVLADRERVAHAALRLTHADDAYVLGRGLSFAAAQEVALKLKETSYMGTQAYSTAEFQHGPIAAISPRAPVLLLATGDATRSSNAQAAARLHELQADLTVVTSARELLAGAHATVPLPAGLQPATEAFLLVMVGQLLALHLTVSRGYDPDRPRNISKVTRTI